MVCPMKQFAGSGVKKTAHGKVKIVEISIACLGH